jgi:hypothetical protein
MLEEKYGMLDQEEFVNGVHEVIEDSIAAPHEDELKSFQKSMSTSQNS